MEKHHLIIKPQDTTPSSYDSLMMKIDEYIESMRNVQQEERNKSQDFLKAKEMYQLLTDAFNRKYEPLGNGGMNVNYIPEARPPKPKRK